jgi:hypothetical protein
VFPRRVATSLIACTTFFLACASDSKASNSRSRPRAEVLSGEVLICDLVQILVYVRGIHCVLLSVSVYILKQLVTEQILTSLNDLCEPTVIDIHCMFDTTLALKFECDRRPVYLDMLISHCC